VPTVEPEGLSDPEVLELTAAEGRVLVTANIREHPSFKCCDKYKAWKVLEPSCRIQCWGGK
jgi:hypothetical protein